MCNVLIICFGPRVSPLLFKGKAVEITSLVALFVAPSRVHVFSAASLSSIPTLLLLQSFSFSLTYTMAGADDQVYDDVVSREEEEYNAAIEAAVRGVQERPQIESVATVAQLRHNLRSLLRSHLCIRFQLTRLVFLRYQQPHSRLRKYCPRQVKHSHHLHLDPVERYRSRGLYARLLLENWDLLRNKLTLHLPLISGWRTFFANVMSRNL